VEEPVPVIEFNLDLDLDLDLVLVLDLDGTWQTRGLWRRRRDEIATAPLSLTLSPR